MDNFEIESEENSPEALHQELNDQNLFSYNTEEASEYLLKNGYRVAPRTISWHCQTNLLDCKKFTHGNVLKWKITKQSLDERIEALTREGNATASNNEQQPASLPASNSPQEQAPESGLAAEIISVMRGELDAKNRQIAEFQSIIKDHNHQFENLNRTIQLSNQTIQQLNKTLALPQVKDLMASAKQSGINWKDGEFSPDSVEGDSIYKDDRP